MVSYMKLTWNYETAKFGQEKKIETDGTRLRRGRQFQFFSWPNLDGFIISVSFMYETTASFVFEPKTEKIPTFFDSFKRKPAFLLLRFLWNFNSKSAVSWFLGVQKLKLKVVSLKPRVSTEEEAGWFHWNQGFRLRRGRRPPSLLSTLGFNQTTFSFSFWTPKNHETADLLLKFLRNRPKKSEVSFWNFFLIGPTSW